MDSQPEDPLQPDNQLPEEDIAPPPVASYKKLPSTLPHVDISDKVVVIGYSGSGKTTLLDYFVKHGAPTPRYIIDTVNYFSYVPSYNFSGITKCKSPAKDQICMKLHSEEQFEALLWYLNHKKDRFFLVVDEIDRYTNVNHLHREVKLFLEEGRNFGRGGIFAVRRVGFLNKSILGNSHYLFVFKINNYRDLQYLSMISSVDVLNLEYHDEHSFYIIDLHTSKVLGEYKVAV